MNQVYQGIPVVIMPKFDPIEFLQTIEKYKITWVLAVPPMMLVFARHPGKGSLTVGLPITRYSNAHTRKLSRNTI